MKGFISGWVAVGAIAILIFVANASLNLTTNNDSFIKMEAAREVNVKTNNLIWILDKATSKTYYDESIPPACDFIPPVGIARIETYLQEVINNFNIKSLVECGFSEGPEITGAIVHQLNVTGTLECSVSVEGFKVTETRDVEIYKQAVPTNITLPGAPIEIIEICQVDDRISGITEQDGI